MSLFKVAGLLNIPNSISLYFTAILVLRITYYKEIRHSDYTFHKQKKKKRQYLFSVIIYLVSGICSGWKKSLPLVIKVSEFQADFLAYWFSLQRQSNFRLLTLMCQKCPFITLYGIKYILFLKDYFVVNWTLYSRGSVLLCWSVRTSWNLFKKHSWIHVDLMTVNNLP